MVLIWRECFFQTFRFIFKRVLAARPCRLQYYSAKAQFLVQVSGLSDIRPRIRVPPVSAGGTREMAFAVLKNKVQVELLLAFVQPSFPSRSFCHPGFIH